MGVTPITLSFTRQNRIPIQKRNPFHADLVLLQKLLRNGNTENTMATAKRLLGYGPGLTPAGDDVILGMLLSLNRWKPSNNAYIDLPRLNARIIEVAYRQTTTLSANLIECATLGLANEQLVDAIDFVMGTPHKIETILPRLLGWGDTSGVATFVGMTLTL